eukprot:g29597.t1
MLSQSTLIIRTDGSLLTLKCCVAVSLCRKVTSEADKLSMTIFLLTIVALWREAWGQTCVTKGSQCNTPFGAGSCIEVAPSKLECLPLQCCTSTTPPSCLWRYAPCAISATAAGSCQNDDIGRFVCRAPLCTAVDNSCTEYEKRVAVESFTGTCKTYNSVLNCSFECPQSEVVATVGCPRPPPCKIRTCSKDPAKANVVCTYANQTNGVACSDGGTFTGTCSGGVCTLTPQVTPSSSPPPTNPCEGNAPNDACFKGTSQGKCMLKDNALLCALTTCGATGEPCVSNGALGMCATSTSGGTSTQVCQTPQVTPSSSPTTPPPANPCDGKSANDACTKGTSPGKCMPKDNALLCALITCGATGEPCVSGSALGMCATSTSGGTSTQVCQTPPTNPCEGKVVNDACTKGTSPGKCMPKDNALLCALITCGATGEPCVSGSALGMCATSTSGGTSTQVCQTPPTNPCEGKVVNDACTKGTSPGKCMPKDNALLCALITCGATGEPCVSGSALGICATSTSGGTSTQVCQTPTNPCEGKVVNDACTKGTSEGKCMQKDATSPLVCVLITCGATTGDLCISGSSVGNCTSIDGTVVCQTPQPLFCTTKKPEVDCATQTKPICTVWDFCNANTGVCTFKSVENGSPCVVQVSGTIAGIMGQCSTTTSANGVTRSCVERKRCPTLNTAGDDTCRAFDPRCSMRECNDTTMGNDGLYTRTCVVTNKPAGYGCFLDSLTNTGTKPGFCNGDSTSAAGAFTGFFTCREVCPMATEATNTCRLPKPCERRICRVETQGDIRSPVCSYESTCGTSPDPCVSFECTLTGCVRRNAAQAGTPCVMPPPPGSATDPTTSTSSVPFTCQLDSTSPTLMCKPAFCLPGSNPENCPKVEGNLTNPCSFWDVCTEEPKDCTVGFRDVDKPCLLPSGAVGVCVSDIRSTRVCVPRLSYCDPDNKGLTLSQQCEGQTLPPCAGWKACNTTNGKCIFDWVPDFTDCKLETATGTALQGFCKKETINNVLRSVCKELPCQRENVAYGANCPLPTLCEKRTCQVAYTSGMPSAVCEYFPLEPYSVCSFTGPNGWTVSGECADGSCRPRPTCPPDGVADVDCPVPKSCQIRKCSIFPTTTGAVRKCEYYNTCQQPPDSCQEAVCATDAAGAATCMVKQRVPVGSPCRADRLLDGIGRCGRGASGVFECLPRFCDDTFTKCDPAPVCKKISGCVEPDATTTPATVGSCTYGNLDAGTPCREGDKFGTCQASQVAGAMVCQLSNDLKWVYDCSSVASANICSTTCGEGVVTCPLKCVSAGAVVAPDQCVNVAQPQPRPCPAPRPACCSDELKLCPDDVTVVKENPWKNCELNCPAQPFCDSAYSKCAQYPCQTITGCKETEKVCTYETKPASERCYNKEKEYWGQCLSTAVAGGTTNLACVCPMDRLRCADNRTLTRDPTNKCMFPECPPPPPHWKCTEWSDCDQVCGPGISRRECECYRANGTKVADSECKTPKYTEKPCFLAKCFYRWKAVYGQCSAPCGPGWIVPELDCLNFTGGSVPLDNCDPNLRPQNKTCNLGDCKVTCAQAPSQTGYVFSGASSTRSCTCAAGYLPANFAGTVECDQEGQWTQATGCTPSYSWSAGSYTACSVTCGDGTKTRAVTCKQDATGEAVDSSKCDATTKPVQAETCNDGDCYAWDEGEYGDCSVACGQGTKTRTVVCEQNGDTTVPDANCANVGTKPATSMACEGTTAFPINTLPAGYVALNAGGYACAEGYTGQGSATFPCQQGQWVTPTDCVQNSPTPSISLTASQSPAASPSGSGSSGNADTSPSGSSAASSSPAASPSGSSAASSSPAASPSGSSAASTTASPSASTTASPSASSTASPAASVSQSPDSNTDTGGASVSASKSPAGSNTGTGDSPSNSPDGTNTGAAASPSPADCAQYTEACKCLQSNAEFVDPAQCTIMYKDVKCIWCTKKVGKVEKGECRAPQAVPAADEDKAFNLIEDENKVIEYYREKCLPPGHASDVVLKRVETTCGDPTQLCAIAASLSAATRGVTTVQWPLLSLGVVLSLLVARF